MVELPDQHAASGDAAGRVDVECVQRILLEVARATASHRDLQSLLRDLADLLHCFGRFDRVAIVLHDAERNLMRLDTLASRQPARVTQLELPIEESPAGVAWQTQQPVVLPRLDGERRFAPVIRVLLDEGMRSACVLPLTSPLRRLGGLSFASRNEDAFGEREVEVLRELTNQVALAVDNTFHHEAAERAQSELARERDRLQLLLEVNNAIVSNLEPRQLFAAIASCMRRVVPHDYTSLGVYDAQRNVLDLQALEFAGKGFMKEHMSVPVDESPSGLAFSQCKPCRLDRSELERFPGEIARLLVAEGIESVCCVPLSARDRCLGTLSVGRLGGEPFSAADEELLAAVANQVAYAVENALAYREIAALKDKLAAEKVYLEDEIRTHSNFEEIIGESPGLTRVLHQVETVAPTNSSVLVRGETGTGKELIARAIHDLSSRRGRTFVKLNCAAIPTGLLESELFGHERGAFTGAIAQRIGRFELADGGTLFLDEVGDIPLELQPKLLRVLQEQEFERVGSTRTIRVDVRLVTATHRNLEEMVAAGTFRSDLYYRLNVFPLTLPPLRERREDIPPLIRALTQRFAQRLNKRIDAIPADVIASLSQYDWPGNVRELENAIERAVILTTGSVLQVPIAEFRGRPAEPPAGTLSATEREAILRAPARHQLGARRTARRGRTPGPQANDAPGPHAQARHPSRSRGAVSARVVSMVHTRTQLPLPVDFGPVRSTRKRKEARTCDS